MRICAGGFLVRHGEVLLGLRSPKRSLYPAVWDAIGGHAEPDEPPAALARELTEELQVTPTEFRHLATLTEPRPEVNGEAVYHLFLVWSGAGPSLNGDEHSEIRWFLIKDAIRLDLAHPAYVNLFKGLSGHD
jgi:8-oxo-dGTP diphosphatase